MPIMRCVEHHIEYRDLSHREFAGRRVVTEILLHGQVHAKHISYVNAREWARAIARDEIYRVIKRHKRNGLKLEHMGTLTRSSTRANR